MEVWRANSYLLLAWLKLPSPASFSHSSDESSAGFCHFHSWSVTLLCPQKHSGKNSPGTRRGWPRTSSAGETPRSSFTELHNPTEDGQPSCHPLCRQLATVRRKTTLLTGRSLHMWIIFRTCGHTLLFKLHSSVTRLLITASAPLSATKNCRVSNSKICPL